MRIRLIKKGISIGVDDFRNVIEENCYFVDKSKFIEEILNVKIGVAFEGKKVEFRYID